jgi:hypothetical protein
VTTSRRKIPSHALGVAVMLAALVFLLGAVCAETDAR